MTDHRAHNHRDQAVDHRLTHHQHALTNALDDILDAEAGLREILIHSRHDTAVDDLDTVLDTEAGLAAVLPPTPEPANPPSTHGTPQDHTGAQEFLLLSPADRMALRNHPRVKEASQARASALAHARDLDLTLGRALALAHDLTHDRALALARDRALDRALALAHALGRARALALDPALALDRARDLALDRARDLDLDRALDLALDLARALDLDFDRAQALAHAHARDFTHALVRGFDLGRVRDRAHDLTRIVLDIHAAEVRRAIGLALRREPPEIDEDSLHTLLNDFTTADLSDADLTDMDLSGVHWSEHGTQWPPALDVEDLKARSDETPPGSGTWTVRSGTATIRDLAGL
ncbi:hypothetical protein V1L54_27400 [Streptomyces sp. TRM 70361]|uniref:hypothetical protein n=1 Tax=Streptomyces sp. TRM 70361 TaxID=3116553 RepID=UPI002E7B3559|nr:hypothetical protein [Streptomyces sp. TRM 70361]MEE1943087.1 hypothetical protein [Streptomyces sp. TRM 70361]